MLWMAWFGRNSQGNCSLQESAADAGPPGRGRRRSRPPTLAGGPAARDTRGVRPKRNDWLAASVPLGLLLVALPLGGLPLAGVLPRRGPYREGLEAFDQGRFREALEAFRAAEAAAGEAVSAELLFNKALAGLQAGALTEAESSAEQAAALGGPRFGTLRDFLLGNAAFARAESIERQAETPGAPPFAYDEALAMARSARRAWERAAMGRPDWPAARRNVERALCKAQALEQKKAARVQEQAERLAAGERPILVLGEDPEGEAASEEAEQTPVPQAESAGLSQGELQRLFEALETREREKLDLRRAGRLERGRAVERDW